MSLSTPSGFTPASEKTSSPVVLDISARVRNELDGGERLLWTGQPIPSRLFRASFVIYLFAIPWTAFSLFWESMALTPLLGGFGWVEGSFEKVPLAFSIVFPLFGLPFIGIGFWMLSRPFAILGKAKRTIYALTDRRAIIMDGGSTSEVESFPLDRLKGEIVKRERSDGSGSLYFSFKRTVDGHGHVHLGKNGFEHIPNVREAHEKIRRAVGSFERTEQEKEKAE